MAGGWMEREIANIAAASAMRGFRYMVFPPIVFEAAPVVTVSLSALTPMAAVMPEAVMPEPPTALAPRLPDPPRVVAQPASLPAPPQTSAPQPAQFATLVPAHAHATSPGPSPGPSPVPERRFALVAEVSAELRRQGAA